MSYPGSQVTARREQQRRYAPGEHPSGPIGPFGPVRDGFDDQAAELSAAYAGYARPASSAPAAPQATIPRQGRGRHAGTGHQGARDGGAAARPPGPRRGPAAGYPPRAGEPGFRYQQAQFSAWNGPAAPAEPAGHQPLPAAPLATAPTWADASETATLRPAPGRPGHAGAALAERPDDLAGYSDDEVEELAAEFAEAAALAVAEPAITGTRGCAPAGDVTTLSRAAAAQARKAARRRGRTRRRMVVTGVCLPAVAAMATMAYMHHPAARVVHPAAPAHAPSAAVPVTRPAPSLGPWQHIGTRAEDPAPLTLSQLYPAQFTAGGFAYARTAQLGSTDCASAVFGARLQAAVRKDGCSQVMRASYLSAGQKLMGTIGVLNLTDSATASAVGKVTGSSEFIAQLTAASGPTRNLAKGTGLEEADVKGHYLILTWVEFTDLRAPRTAAQKMALKTFSANLINQTANVSLTSRMVTGQPQVP